MHSERQWKEMLVMVAGMSGRMAKRKEDACMEAGSTRGGAAAVGVDPFAAMAAQLTPQASRLLHPRLYP